MINNHKSVRWRRIFSCNLLFLMFTLPLTAQDLLVTGKVTDGKLPISGANVIIKNTNRGVVTDFDGRYKITAKPTDTLQISYLGYTTLTIPIQSRPTINITLQEDATALGEVQINAGYYTTTDREKTGSISKITAKEIETQPVSNPLEALMGRLTGVDIVPTSGVPGSGIAIKIRGISSIMAGTTPLYLIDGIPFAGNSISNSNISGQIMPSGSIDPLHILNPALIENIEVLKDADATAIYGSRGANGVILITTKKGKQGQTQFSLNTSTGIGHVANKTKLLNTEQYLEMRKQAHINDGYTSYPANAHDINGTWDQNRFTDWQELLIGGTARTQNLQGSVSGGSEQTTFLLSGMYNNETTVFPGEFRFNRINVNSHIAHISKNKKLKLNFTTGYGHSNNLQPRKDLTFEALTLPPNGPSIYDDSGTLNWENSTWTNPLAYLGSTYQNKIHSLTSSLNISYKLYPNLFAKINVGYNKSEFEEGYILPHTVINPAFGATSSNTSRIFNNNSNDKSWIIEPQLNWEYETGLNKIKILTGATFQKNRNTEFHIGGIGFANNTLINNLSAASTLLIMGQNEVSYKYQSTFARLNYSYNDSWILNLTGRRDGSSRFGPGNRYGNFGAIGTAWIFSNNHKSNWLNLGKIRGSFGVTGNDQIGDYQYLQTYTINPNQSYDGNLGILPSRLYNPLFKWEQNKKFEVALETKLFVNRLGILIAFYNNQSSNQLVSYALPATTGFSSINRNLDATVKNHGWELELHGTLVRSEDFNWNSNLNFTVPKNKLTAFPGLETSTYANRYVIGESLQIVKLYKSEGVSSETGLFEFEDYNGDGVINAADRQYVVDLTPKFYGGMSNTFSYRNWNLDVFFQFSKKQAYKLYRYGLVPGSMYNQPISVLSNWQNGGMDADMQRFSTGNNAETFVSYSRFSSSTGTIADGSFIRLKTLALSYSLKLNNNNYKLYFQGQNLLTFTSFRFGDPEQSLGNLPVLKRFVLGLQFEF